MKTKGLSNLWTVKKWYGCDEECVSINATAKLFRLPTLKKPVPIWIHAERGKGSFSFTVRAGASSSFSYTGHCVGCKTMEEAQVFVDKKFS